MSWHLEDERGAVTEQGAEIHNMILDTALDYFGTGTMWDIMNYCAVGTGSAAPAVTQTALTAEIARSGNVVDSGAAWPADGVLELFTSKQFDFSQANGNLTEWGMSAASAGTLHVRELFRDGGGNPTVVTKTSASRLVLKYRLRLAVTPVVARPFAVPVAGLGTLEGTECMTGGPNSYTLWTWVTNLMKGAAPQVYPIPDGNVPDPATNPPEYGNPKASLPYPDYNYATGSTVDGAYVAGTYRRKYKVLIDTNQFNYKIGALGFGLYDSGGGYYRLLYSCNLKPASRFTKTSDYQLNLSICEVTWGRA